MLRALADAARDGERVAQRLFEETQRGTHVVDQGVRGVEAIRGVVASAKAHVQALGARSSDITAVVDFIADVAGRTNLLSLNVAIIASQAGEHGKPFGVVADHIRELAAQIGSSTQRIDDIIAGVRLEVEATSALIEQSDELAATGVERAREGGEALKRIAAESKRAREIAASIPRWSRATRRAPARSSSSRRGLSRCHRASPPSSSSPVAGDRSSRSRTASRP